METELRGMTDEDLGNILTRLAAGMDMSTSFIKMEVGDSGYDLHLKFQLDAAFNEANRRLDVIMDEIGYWTKT